jgi:ATP-dependent Clp protease ATP-binding subunit ClpC
MQASNRFDKFTDHSRKVMSLAQEEARRFKHNYIGTEHLLLGLVREDKGVAAQVLRSLGIELDKVRSQVEFIIGRGDRLVLGEIGMTPRAKKVIELAVGEAQLLNHQYIGTEHLLLGMIREGHGIAAGVLESLGVNLQNLRAQTLQVLSQSGSTATSSPTLSISELKESVATLELVLHEKEQAVQAQEYELAAELRAKEIELRKQISRLVAD